MTAAGAVDRWRVPGGPTIGVRRWGSITDEPHVVLLHGLNGSSAHLVSLAEHLVDLGWAVSAIDFRGHGASDRVPGTYVIEHYAADVVAYLEHVGVRSVLVGHSLGGATAVHLAGSRPDLVRAAFAEDPPLYHGQPGVMATTPFAAVFRSMRATMQEFHDLGASDDRIREHLLAQGAPGGGRWADSVAQATIDARVESFRDCDPAVWDTAIEGDALAGWDPDRPVSVPLTIVRADPKRGAALTPDEAERFSAANPGARVIEVAGAPHGIREHAATTDRYLRELDAFLAGLVDAAAEAVRIVAAHDARSTLDPISGRASITMDDAYAIQTIVTDARLARGERVAGWKLGYTSAVMREQMGVAEANFGPLTDAMFLDDGIDVGDRFTQPRVEPEVALRFAGDVPVGADRATVLAAVGAAHAALEIVDSVWTDYRFRIEDNTADGSSAAGVVLGPEIDLDRIAEVEVRLLVDDREVGVGHGRDASGHPADGVVWLVERLAARGLSLSAGDVVITGGLTAAAPLVPGGTIRAIFDSTVDVCVRDGRTPLG